MLYPPHSRPNRGRKNTDSFRGRHPHEHHGVLSTGVKNAPSVESCQRAPVVDLPTTSEIADIVTAVATTAGAVAAWLGYRRIGGKYDADFALTWYWQARDGSVIGFKIGILNTGATEIHTRTMAITETWWPWRKSKTKTLFLESKRSDAAAAVIPFEHIIAPGVSTVLYGSINSPEKSATQIRLVLKMAYPGTKVHKRRVVFTRSIPDPPDKAEAKK